MVGPQSQYDPGFTSFGGGASSSILHPAVLGAVIAVAALTFVLPRKYVIAPLLLGILLIPSGQNVYLGVHLYIYRILILLGWVRLLASRSSSGRLVRGGLTTLDKIFLVWSTYEALAVILLYAQAGAAVNQAGFLLDSLGGYFLFRSLIRDDKDVRRVVMVFAAVAVVSAVVMAIELGTGKNVLGYLGGIRLISEVRNGRIRGQGIFQHSILAGSFGAVSFPLFLWLWKRGGAKLAAVAGAVASSLMVFACASSTPVGAWLGSIFVICLWPLRKRMRAVRWAIVLTVVGLQLAMKAPIWYLMARIDFAGGSSGWDRAFLVDTFTKHIGSWWLIGTHDNVNWGWDMWDQCNQFVTEGETGGLVALTCFIATIVFCFKKIGKARKALEGNARKEWMVWLLGAALFAQIMAFIGVDYFDQSRFVWYALLAMIPAATMLADAVVAKPSPESALGVGIDNIPMPQVEDVMAFDQLPNESLSQRWVG